METLKSLSKDKFLSRVERTSTCWLWNGSINFYGYGTIFLSGKSVGAHRVAYELFRGSIPPNMQIDHLCYVKNCVFPDHLEVVTISENSRRMQAHYGRPKVCRKGHPFDEINTCIRTNGRRFCKICRNVQARRYQKMERNILYKKEWLKAHPNYLKNYRLKRKGENN